MIQHTRECIVAAVSDGVLNAIGQPDTSEGRLLCTSLAVKRLDCCDCPETETRTAAVVEDE